MINSQNSGETSEGSVRRGGPEEIAETNSGEPSISPNSHIVRPPSGRGLLIGREESFNQLDTPVVDLEGEEKEEKEEETLSASGHGLTGNGSFVDPYNSDEEKEKKIESESESITPLEEWVLPTSGRKDSGRGLIERTYSFEETPGFESNSISPRATAASEGESSPPLEEWVLPTLERKDSGRGLINRTDSFEETKSFKNGISPGKKAAPSEKPTSPRRRS